MKSFQEKLVRAPASIFFIIFSYDQEEIFFDAKKMTEKDINIPLYESVKLPTYFEVKQREGQEQYGRFTQVISFKRRIHREELPELKTKCLKIQTKFSSKDPSLKLLPGYLNPHNLILTSSYDELHRIYLFHGVFAEIIYQYEGRKFIPSEKAPGFFKLKETRYFFTMLRESFSLKDI